MKAPCVPRVHVGVLARPWGSRSCVGWYSAFFVELARFMALRGTGILVRRLAGDDIDQIGNDIDMSRQRLSATCASATKSRWRQPAPPG
jgi:hypothetical protein